MKGRETNKHRLAIASAALLLFLTLTPARAGQSPLARLREKIQSIGQLIWGKKKEIQATVARKQSVAEQLNESQDRLDEAEDQLAASRKRLDAARAAVSEAERRLQEAQARVKLQQSRFGHRIAVSYVQGPVTYLDVVLGARDFNDFLDREYCVEQIMEQDGEILGSLREAKQEVARQHAVLVARQKELLAAHVEIAARERALAQRTGEQKQLLAKVNNSLQLQEQQLEDLEEDSRAVEADLQRELRRRRLLRKQHPGLYRPLSKWTGYTMPAPGAITSGFAMRFHPILKRMRMHTGLDIAAGYGAPIRAAASGEVFLAGLKGGYGKCIIILHGSGVSTLYGHCSRMVVRPGQRVNRGEVIGYVGSTGLSTGPHLHFEVRRNGRPVNPL